MGERETCVRKPYDLGRGDLDEVRWGYIGILK